MSDRSTALLYFALLASPDDTATRISAAAAAEFERVEGDAQGHVLYRALAPGLTLELQNVDERLEGTVYSLVAMKRGVGAPEDLDAHLHALARDAGAERRWSPSAYRALQDERAV
jgi:hypothetical protein